MNIKKRKRYKFCNSKCSSLFINPLRKTYLFDKNNEPYNNDMLKNKRTLNIPYPNGVCEFCHAPYFRYRPSKNNQKCCSYKCTSLLIRYKTKQEHLNKWLLTPEKIKKLHPVVKIYLKEEQGDKCSECGWNKKNPSNGICRLDIHHKDGDSTNNKPNNLKVLCQNCHSLTSTYTGLNYHKNKK